MQALGFFVVTALVFLWVAASGLAELSAQAQVVFSGGKPGAVQKNGKKRFIRLGRTHTERGY